MAFFDLPESLLVNGTEYKIYSDYRIALGIIEALNDANLTDEDRGEALLAMLFPAFLGDEDGVLMPPEDYNEAVEQGITYINGGTKDDGTKKPKLMDWEQDFPILIAPINKVAGMEVRSVDYMHWYTFLGYFNEIGDCLFSQVVSMRKKLNSGKKLDKADREFLKNNRDLIVLKQQYSSAEEDILAEWT